MPDPAGAGSMRIVTGAPEWRPTPVNSRGCGNRLFQMGRVEAKTFSNCEKQGAWIRLDARWQSLSCGIFATHLHLAGYLRLISRFGAAI